MTSKGLISSAGDEEPLVRVGDGAVDRMPGLSVIFADVARRFEKYLRNYAEGISVSVEQFQAIRLGDLEMRHPAGRLYVFRAGDTDFWASVIADGVIRELLFELLLGSGVIEIDADRPSTRLQDRITAHGASMLVSEFSHSFASFARFDFARDVVAEEAGLLALGSKAAVILHTNITLSFGGHEAHLLFAVPRSALDPFRDALSRLPDAGGRATDENWSEKLYNSLVKTEVRAQVRIEARGFTLGDIARLEVGDVLRLPIAPTDLIRVVAENRTLFWCTLGQKDGLYTVRLEEFSDENESHLENILGV